MVVLLLVTSLTKIQVFVTTISRFATEISEVCNETLWSSCVHGGNSTIQLALPHEFTFWYKRSRTVETWGSWIVILFQFFEIQSYAKSGSKTAKNSQFSASNSIKLERNKVNIEQYLNCFKFQQSGFVYSKTWIHVVVPAERCYSHYVYVCNLDTMVQNIHH